MRIRDKCSYPRPCPSEAWDRHCEASDAEASYILTLLREGIKEGYVNVDDAVFNNGYHTFTVTFPVTQYERDEEAHWAKMEEYEKDEMESEEE